MFVNLFVFFFFFRTPTVSKPARRKLFTPKYDEILPPQEETNHQPIKPTHTIDDPNLKLKLNIPTFLLPQPNNKLLDTVKMIDIGQIHTTNKTTPVTKRTGNLLLYIYSLMG